MADEATLRDALQRLIDAVWQRPNRAAFTIPADMQRDADLILSDAIDELVRLRAALVAERAQQVEREASLNEAIRQTADYWIEALAVERERSKALVAAGDALESAVDALQVVHDDDPNGIEAAWQDIFNAFAGWRKARAARGEG